ncbi:small subunit processome component 20 homolog [Acyrthosiphon pisum]|uniref:Small subunit processome component 20 homolog n=1 Tax=Acyrthosiphon pisum TaxID=7029 RepID=A0A8R1W3I7_ACYPI|nr:small subunit processome component 20 homolog [Acyrthosiphon pisum]|eukprot:XP_001952794.2 PREDICTED: small subunit processome component 20 homolog [Acyrthosiphon pisum]
MKPHRHKEYNRFKFQPFSERISEIDVDVFHRVGHSNEDLDDTQKTRFSQAIERWNDLNRSESYNQLCSNLKQSQLESLPQLLARKHEISQVLFKYMDDSDPLSIQAAFEFVVAFAQDLQQEFYEYFPEFLRLCIKLLRTKDAEQIEWSFTCLAYLFKFLWRLIVRDIKPVFECIVLLLGDDQPPYVNDFAAESFSFVARKVKDKKHFLKMVLKNLKHKKDSIYGCSKLLFEVIKGMAGGLHTCADYFLPVYLNSLADMDISYKLLNDVLDMLFDNILGHIEPKKSTPIWTILKNTTSEFLANYNNNQNERTTDNLNQALILCHRFIAHKNGSCIQNLTEIFEWVLSYLNCLPQLAEDHLHTLSSIVSTLCLSNIGMPSYQANVLIEKIMSTKNINILVAFTEQMYTYINFELSIIQKFLNFVAELITANQEIPKSIVICLSRYLSDNSSLKSYGYDKWRINYKNTLYGRHNDSEIIGNYILKYLENIQISNCDADNIPCYLILLQHFCHNEINSTNILKNLLELTTKKLENPDVINLFSFLNIIETIMRLKENFNDWFDLHKLIPKLKSLLNNKFGCCALVLEIIHVLISNLQIQISDNYIKELETKLIDLLSSPYHQVRLTSCKILVLINSPTHTHLMERNSLFKLLESVEIVPVSLNEYRARLLRIQHLDNNDTFLNTYKTVEDASEIAVKFLLGNLHINFRPIWDPVVKLIVSHAKISKTFWPVYEKQLELSVKHDNYVIKPAEPKEEFMSDFISERYKKLNNTTERVDINNYRILLWNSMVDFGDLIELKNKDIVTHFLNFIRTEYMQSNSELANSWNIKQNSDEANLETDIEDNLNETSSEESFSSNKSLTKLLLSHLKLMSTIRNPKGIYKESEVFDVYLSLLSNKNAEIQKAAFDCLLTYKQKHVTPYKENLYKLINEKSFKAELVMFRVDSESEAILSEHRPLLMPLIMRMIYGKLLGGGGPKSGSKCSGQNRRTAIMRFLVGCEERELIVFMQMVFRVLNCQVQFSECPLVMTRHIVDTLDLEHVLPPRRLLSSVNMCAVILKQCGALSGTDGLYYMLRVLLCVGANVKAILMHRSSVHAGYFSTISKVRVTTVETLTTFFQHFENFSWNKSFLDSVFEVFIEPSLSKMPVECLQHPTPLMKLLVVWSQIPRYYCLLGYPINNLTPIEILIDILTSDKTHGGVKKIILEVIDRLLTFDGTYNDAMDVDVPALDIPLPSLPSEYEDVLNVGSRLLYNYLPTILKYLYNELSKKRGVGLASIEMSILTRASELVRDQQSSSNLLSLLFPVLLKKATGDDMAIAPLFATVNCLVANVDDVGSLPRQLATLYGTVIGQHSRNMLLEFTKIISKKSPNSNIHCDILYNLNAWDKRHLDQPDFDCRMNALKKIKDLLDSNDISVEFGAFVIYNCFYIFNNVNDIGLRDTASTCLKNISCYLCLKYAKQSSERTFILDSVLLPSIRNGIQGSKELVQYETISLLGHLSRKCAHVHFVFNDLQPLSNETDLEGDFFENIQHLQTYRKVKALHRFCEIMKKSYHCPRPKTIVHYLLPLANQFLCSQKYSAKNSLVDAAIDAVTTMSRILPWQQYETLLKLYLNKMRQSIDFQKQTVRIVSGILDSFHFDLSRTAERESKVIQNSTPVKNIKDTSQNITQNHKSEIEKLHEVENEMDVDDNDDDENENNEINELILEKIHVLCPSTAIKITKAISVGLLPQLNKNLAQYSESDRSHKINRKQAEFDKEEMEMLKIPVALAVVKLLKKLPKIMLEENLQGVFMKLCTFLKSRLESVRRVTRETLQNIMVTLGTSYMSMLLNEMTALLTQGFQVHVLIYTIHAIFVSLSERFEKGHMDSCLPYILEVVKVDLFGSSSDEKEVTKIAGKTVEARGNKSYNTLHIAAEFVTEKCLINIIMPFKEILFSTLSFKNIRKCNESLRHIVTGLVDNKFINTESLLEFAYGIVSQSVPALNENSKQEIKKKEELKKPDSYIIPQEPKRTSTPFDGTVCARTNAHELVQFGLSLFQFMLKREMLKSAAFSHFVDPFVSLIMDSLKSQHIKLITLSLQCMTWLLKRDLPSVKENIKTISESLFEIIHKYATGQNCTGDNAELVMSAFKTLSTFIREVKYHRLNDDQLRQSVLHAEQELSTVEDGGNTVTTTFTLIKALLSRQHNCPELKELMTHVAKASITCERDAVRTQARQTFYQYLMDYPIGKALNGHIQFFLSQLEYEVQNGRESALEMITSLIKTLPPDVLRNHSSAMFISLGAQMVNDSVASCRKSAAEAITIMLGKLTKNIISTLYEITLTWLQGTKIIHRQLGAQLISLFVTAEGEEFNSRVKTTLPLLCKYLKRTVILDGPGRFVRIHTPIENDQDLDHLLFQCLQTCVNIANTCPSIFTKSSLNEHIMNISMSCQELLRDDHEWVRLGALQFLKKYLSSVDVKAVALCASKKIDKEEKRFLYSNARQSVKSLCLDLVDQIIPGHEILEDVLKDTMESLLFLSDILKLVQSKKVKDDKNELSLGWLLKNLNKLVYIEVSKYPQHNTVRKTVFKYYGALSHRLERSKLISVLKIILKPLIRELSTTDDASIDNRRIAKSASIIVKKKCGPEIYNENCSIIQRILNARRALRRKTSLLQVVTDPELAAKRKIAKQAKKKGNKKRKMEKLKQKTIITRIKKDLDLEEYC